MKVDLRTLPQAHLVDYLRALGYTRGSARKAVDRLTVFLNERK